jgi:phosphate transport system substrate-binding protein
LFIYVSRQALARPEVAEFVRFYLTHAPELVGQVGYVPLEDAAYQAELAKLGPGAGAP